MKLTLFGTDENCTEIVKVQIAHVTMFKDYELELQCHLEEEKLKLIKALLQKHILFRCQGSRIWIMNETGSQRIRYRFDS